MQTLSVNGYDMAYLEVGKGPPLVCVHGSLCDFRIWSCVLGPLSREHRVITVSLRHFFPEHWDGVGDTLLDAQEPADGIERPGRGIDQVPVAQEVHLLTREDRQQVLELLAVTAEALVVPERRVPGRHPAGFCCARLAEVVDGLEAVGPQVRPVGVRPVHRITDDGDELRVRNRG